MATRPSYNTGKGFFTLDGKLYDANGVEFKIRGVNCAHYDQFWMTWDPPYHGLFNTKINCNRINTPLWPEISESTLTSLIQKMVDYQIVSIPCVWFTESTYNELYNVTGSNDVDLFNVALSQWVARANVFKPFERYMLVNVANEWGDNNTTWRDTHINAIQTLRKAGYLNTIVVDAGGRYANDYTSIINYGDDIYDSDDQHNIIFSTHIYGYWYVGTPTWEEYEIYSSLAALKNTGLPVMVGEFGSGTDGVPIINDAETFNALTPMDAADGEDIGWLAWAWDDGVESNNRFAMTVDNNFILNSDGSPANGSYPNNTDLTIYGNRVFLNPDTGIFYHPAPRATIFGEGLIF